MSDKKYTPAYNFPPSYAVNNYLIRVPYQVTQFSSENNLKQCENVFLTTDNNTLIKLKGNDNAGNYYDSKNSVSTEQYTLISTADMGLSLIHI